ncbi:antibiotic biosynthesis monooxygenase family protein [Nocardioides yefusunii]|uniref:antibiotic biosynthesis monooxygenase family protein n=1 Tax=Nocardioides yefusunii TaxID=2500546 RepID=UPI0030CB632C
MHEPREDQRHLRPAAGRSRTSAASRARGPDERNPGLPRLPAAAPHRERDRYFVVTQWADEESFVAWRDGDARAAHAGQHGKPVASGAELMEFDVVLDVKP